MNRKKYGIALGAIAIVLLMTSSATAVTTHIDANIKITKSLLPKLNDAYNNIDDGDFKTLLGEIIGLLKTKKVVNSDDIQGIISENNLKIPGAYGLRRIYTEGPDIGRNPGSCGPHIIRVSYFGSFFTWCAQQADWPGLPICVHVGPDTYTCDHEGLVISFIGLASSGFTFNQHGDFWDFRIMGGLGFLIFVRAA